MMIKVIVWVNADLCIVSNKSSCSLLSSPLVLLWQADPWWCYYNDWWRFSNEHLCCVVLVKNPDSVCSDDVSTPVGRPTYV